MKSAGEFQAFYRTTLVPIAEALEAERKKIVKKIYLAAAAAIVFTILYSVFNPSRVSEKKLGPHGPTQYTYTGGWSSALFYVGIAGALGYFFWYRPKLRDFKSRFKNEVIARIVKFSDEGLEYIPTDGISRSEFMQSTIFDTGGDRYLSDDLVSGKIGSTAIRFSEVHTQEKQEIKSEGSSLGLKRWKTLFKGVVFIADFNKHFKGRTVVLTDQAEKTFGSLGTMFQKLNSTRDPLVKMENLDFEKAFVVYSSDATEAHYILTPSLMERIVNLKSRLSSIQLAFYNSVVFVSVPIKENLFEANMFRSLAGHNQMETYFMQLQMFIGVVEELNLNTRIWTKE